MKLLENKIALITGASRGIGRTTAMQFAAQGAHVLFTDLKENDDSASLVAELKAQGVNAAFFATNAADHDQSQALAKTI